MRATRLATAGAVVALCAITLLGCGDEKAPAPEPDAKNGKATKPARTWPGQSDVRVLARVPWFGLRDQEKTYRTSEQLLGKVWIANFMFTRCGGTCPLQTARLAEIQKTMEKDIWRDDVHMVSFTVDPEHDTSDVLTTYAEENHADGTRWSFLTGVRRDIWHLSQKGFKLFAGEDPANADMPIAHSAHFVLVGRRGFIRGYFDSQTADGMEALRTALAAVLEEPAPKIMKAVDGVFRIPWLEPRRKAQIEAAKSYKTFHDFGYVDRRVDSGIRFRHRIVDDGGKDYKAIHYDHGNGVAVADVDGDGKLDLYFTNQVGSNQLWRNKGDGTFEDITKRSGLAVRDHISVTASFADVDNDGDPDLYVTTVYAGNHLFLNDGTGAFEDITKKAGLEHTGHSSASVFFDFDNDGLLDLYVTNVGVYTTEKIAVVANDSTTLFDEPGHYEYRVGVLDAFSGHLKADRTETSRLYRNLGNNRFEDVTKAMGLVDASWSGAASPIDCNDDGWLDLYVLDMQGNDEYFENQEGKGFVRKSREVFPKTPWGSMGVKVFDFENDGDFDLFLTDMHSDMQEVPPPEKEKFKGRMIWPESLLKSGGQSIFGNAFYRKDGPDSYVEISDAIGAENLWPWGFSVGDLNADGFEDAFICSSMNHLFRYQVNSVLLNEGGKRFVDSEFVLGVEPRRGRLSTPWFDLDCDGADLGHRDCGGVMGPVTMYAPLGSRSSVIFDIDGDGDLDVVTNDYNSEPMVLISDLSTKRSVRYLEIALHGTTSNRDGLGAIVRVYVGTQSYMKRHDGQSGYLSQSSCPLYFGLDKAQTADRIEVRWPTGKTQVLKGPIELNRRLVIREE